MRQLPQMKRWLATQEGIWTTGGVASNHQDFTFLCTFCLLCCVVLLGADWTGHNLDGARDNKAAGHWCLFLWKSSKHAQWIQQWSRRQSTSRHPENSGVDLKQENTEVNLSPFDRDQRRSSFWNMCNQTDPEVMMQLSLSRRNSIREELKID